MLEVESDCISVDEFVDKLCESELVSFLDGYERITNGENSSRTFIDLPLEDPATMLDVGSARCTTLASLTLIWFTIGIYVLMASGHDFASALEALMEIVTTIGYGDFTPRTDVGKIIVSILVLSSRLIIARAIVVEFAMRVFIQNQALVIADMESEKKCWKERKPREHTSKLTNVLVINITIFALFLVVGTFYYGLFEKCSCSYGLTYIEGCAQDHCELTGGEIKTLPQAFYMSVATLTTVGFGDFTPTSFYGRCFGSVWMLLGVASTVNLVGTIAAFLQNEGATRKNEQKMEEFFERMDIDGSNSLDKVEFLIMQLQIRGYATVKQIDLIMRQFTTMDRSKDNTIDFEELQAYYLK